MEVREDDYNHVGYIIVDIVGLENYSSEINGGEIVGFVREDLNPYEPNGINVINSQSAQVGRLEKYAARVLAPLIDCNAILVQGTVPPSMAGNESRIPCQVHVFAARKHFVRVKSDIEQGRLHLISNDEVPFPIRLSEWKKNLWCGRRVDEVFKLSDDKEGILNNGHVLEPPKDVFKSELLLHQKQGLSWLVHRENSCELPPFWEEKGGGTFINSLTKHETGNRPNPIRGGIFADDKGLGKTLTLLSLIALDKCDAPPHNVNSDDSEEDFASLDDRKLKEKSHVLSTTLIVCPPPVCSTWKTQLEDHTKPGRLKMFVYDGEQNADASEFSKYDIVLTSYSTLTSEETFSVSPVTKVEWRRVILDEAHEIKDPNAEHSRAVTSLKTDRRWVVTGTPMQNDSMDLFSLMAFLRIEPFSIKKYWNNLVQCPLAQGNKDCLSRLQELIGTISLRRTKDSGSIRLPSKTVETCTVELSENERTSYNQMESIAKSSVKDYISAGSVVGNYSIVLSMILQLRQICTHRVLCIEASLPSNNVEDGFPPEVSGSIIECITSTKVAALVELVSASKKENPNLRSVIFSEFKELLVVLQGKLMAAEFKTLHLDESLTAEERVRIVREFRVAGSDGPTILLASLKASRMDVDLSAASRVYFMEPWWNPTIEEHAINRVHGIGQKENVKVVRLVAKGSIDERILELQEKRRQLAREGFVVDNYRGGAVNIDDIRTLLSL